VHPNEVFGPALRIMGVASIILVHNHPPRAHVRRGDWFEEAPSYFDPSIRVQKIVLAVARPGTA
jgi:hypothetical protein